MSEEQFERLYNELQVRGDREKLMQLALVLNFKIVSWENFETKQLADSRADDVKRSHPHTSL
jgi:hypothetical protein